MRTRAFSSIVIVVTSLVWLAQASQPGGFPYRLPDKKPYRPLSVAMERLYRDYLAPTPESNELYSTFKFTPLEGFDYHGGDGTISRRDPSKVIRVNGKYYIWYTHRATATPPRGAALGTDTVPSTDWDLAEIWYATSEDGFTWQERGVAVPRPPKPHPGWRSVSTADILIWKGKYYLYYQGFLEMSGRRGDDCPVTASVADSPDGPWRPCRKIVIPNGAPGEWDQYSIHDPYPLVYKGKIYLYYKSDFNNAQPHVRAHGLATADDPLGPFTKHPLNPIMNSGHETTLFPFLEGIAAFAIHNGLEHNTIQYSPDGVSFKIAAVSSLMPVAAGPYVPDAFTDTRDGRGITWGLCHITGVGTQETRHSILARFDCDLSRDLDDPRMKQTDLYLKPEAYFSQGLSKQQREQRERAARQPVFLPGDDPKPAGKVWKQVPLLSDEFDGNALDRTKWQDDPTANGWPWYGRAPGLFRAENVKLRDGRLCVTVSKLDAPVVRNGKTFTHQGAIVRSFHPGRPGWYFECRMKANATVMSSTFWLITKPGSEKGLELDIQECVGLVTEKTAPWAKKWDRIFHSNLIHWTRPEKVQLQGSVPTPTKNSERFYVYGAWWKSPEEVRFYLDGKYVYSIKPKVAWDVPSFIQMAIETYDWNPIPEDGGLVETGTWEERTTQYEWVRTWELADEAVAPGDASPARK